MENGKCGPVTEMETGRGDKFLDRDPPPHIYPLSSLHILSLGNHIGLSVCLVERWSSPKSRLI